MRDAAIAAERAGRPDEAARIFSEACAAYPRDASLLNSAGSFHARARDHARALVCFDGALAIQRDHGEAILNRAVTLSALGRDVEARRALVEAEPLLGRVARYWSARAAAERAGGDLSAAAFSYDRCLAIEPAHPRALHGRARAALERGEPEAADRYHQALAVTPGDAELWLGHAQSLAANGDTPRSLEIAAALVGQLPSWIAALELLAELRWATGERDLFSDHYETAVAQVADPAPLFRSWCGVLQGVDRYSEAAEVAARAAGVSDDDSSFRLMEAVHTGEAGDDERAARIFDTLALVSADRHLHEARHWLRLHDPARAEQLLASVIAERPGDVGAWALRDLAWRMMGDDRHQWLHGQPGLVALHPLALDASEFDAIVAMLDRVHDTAAVPIGQSVRDGTQTKGSLFDRHEPEAAVLRRAVADTLAEYRAGLPASDPRHPLLAHRDMPWRFAGSWSVRLARAGRHVAHIHPVGLISSASYFRLPPADPADRDGGTLELGASPGDLRIDVPAFATITPKLGYCALFPSTLYHGTRRFGAGQRMTAAFDVAI